MDKKYKKASKSGREKQTMIGLEEGYDTGSRRKNYFDVIIFTQDANPPDHWTFASHYYLRDSNTYDYFSGSNKGKKKKKINAKGENVKEKQKYYYLNMPLLMEVIDMKQVERRELVSSFIHH